jgi:phytoene desaturase
VARVVVVGAGMGGLAVAARLAAQGHSVTVCEQSCTYGGKVGVFHRAGFSFDTGPAALTLPAVYRDLFIKTGQPLEESVKLAPVDPAARYRFADGTWLDMPNASSGRTARALDEALGPGTGDDWTRLMSRAADIWEVTRRALESPPEGPRDLPSQARRVRDLRTARPWRSLRGVSRRYLDDPRLRTVLDRYATCTGSDPRQAPAALAVMPYIEQTFGSWYVTGGLRRLADALYERCLERGVTVRLGADVVQVTVSGDKADGVRLADNTRLPADAVVAGVDARHLYADLVEAPPALARLRNATPSLSAFMLLLALRGRTPGLAHHTVLFGADADAELDGIFGAEAAPAEAPTIQVAAPDDPALRPDDAHEAWSVLVNAPRHGKDQEPGTVDWEAPGLAERYADRVLAQLAERDLEVRDRLLWREVRTPADLERATRSPGGASYGAWSHGRRAALSRPANRSPVPGLFLVGSSAHPGGTLPLVGMSAAIVAQLIGRA